MQPDESLANNRITKLLIWVLVIYYVFFITLVIYAQRNFFADGPWDFIRVLREGSFYKLSTARYFANCFQQVFLVAFMKAGIKDIDILSYPYAFGSYFPQVASLLLSYHIVKKHDKRLMFFPLLYNCIGPINGSFVMISESQVLVSLFWPMFFYLTVKKEFKATDSLLLTFCSIIFLRSYEGAVFLAPVLIVILSVNYLKNRAELNKITVVTYIVNFLLFIASTVIAVYFIVNPVNSGNKASFLYSLHYLKLHIPFLMSCCYLVCIVILILSKTIARSRFVHLLVFPIIICSILVSLSPLITPELARPKMQFQVRAFMVYFLPLYAFFVFFIAKGKITIVREAWRKIGFLLVILIISQLTWQVITTCQWMGLRSIFKQELANHSGIVKFEDTMLNTDIIGTQIIKPFIWEWTSPALSIAWAPRKNVRTIILNRQENSLEAFDPHDMNAYPHLERYGITYGAELH